tara:strand:+ start:9843 stop:11240 length:1398 start_codon:yes stop_codon:yes gene_type:complete
MKKFAAPVIVGIILAGLAVLVIQFIPSFNGGQSVDRFRNVPPMEPGTDIISDSAAMMAGNAPGSQGLAGQDNSQIPTEPADELPEGVVISRETNSLDHTLVADHFQVALVLQPRQLLAAPQVEPLIALLSEALPVDLVESVELDPGSIESIVILVDSLPAPPTLQPVEDGTDPAVEAEEGEDPAIDTQDPADQEPTTDEEPAIPAPMELAVIVKLAEGDASEVAIALSRGIPGLWKEEEIGGKPGRVNALPLPPPIPTGICVFDERTLLVSSPATITKMLEAKGTSPLAERLATVDLSNDVVLVATPGILPEGAMDGTASAQFNPLAMLQGLPDKLQTASVAIRLSSDPVFQIELEAPDDQSARDVHNSIRSTLSLTQVIIDAQKNQFTDNPTAPDGYLETMEFISTLLNSSTLGRTNSPGTPENLITVISVALTEEITNSLETIIPQMLAPGEAEEPAEEGETP